MAAPVYTMTPEEIAEWRQQLHDGTLWRLSQIVVKTQARPAGCLFPHCQRVRSSGWGLCSSHYVKWLGLLRGYWQDFLAGNKEKP